jgi:CCR4-NOT transcriptional complex subunit CAF120
MTKAFMPQGLLSAGLQDKEDRSARRQEELARESGASLINVPNKPPPPQTGLLGAITAHERERKREGGVGAALTEREREKRVAEERQRRFDDHQRQQLDQMQQGGSVYGGQFGFNPMMANPMMMGMNPMMGLNPMISGNGMNPMMTGGGLNPMMTGGGMAPLNPMMTGQMGYPGMMGGFNPQHMFAAQQAAQAYQQAMMAFSVAGSQVGGEGGNGGAPSQVNAMNPGMGGANTGMGSMNGLGGGMNPAMTGGMGGFDPRMSMMGMPMMGMGMGMGVGVAPPQMHNQLPLGMQTTGMSNFDPKSSPGGANVLPAGDLGLLPPNQNTQLSSRTSSPAGRGSSLARGGAETADRGRPSRPTSPK